MAIRKIGEFLQFGHAFIPLTTVFYQTKLSYAFVNFRPIIPGHVLVSCKRPVEKMSGLTSEEVTDLFLTVQRVTIVLEKLHKTASTTISMHNGPDAGQTVKHVHVHIIPRKKGDFQFNDDIYKELERHDTDDRESRSQVQMELEAEILRQFFTNDSN